MIFNGWSDDFILSLPFSFFGENNEIFRRKIKIISKRYCYGETRTLIRFLNEMLSHWHVKRNISTQEILSIFEKGIREETIWWLKKQHNLDKAKAKYMCVVALLESINYDC